MATETQRRHGNDHRWTGLILLSAGGLLLLYKMGLPIPSWVFTWPMLLVALGLITGLKSNFQNRGWIILMLIGGIFLVDNVVPSFSLHDYILPIILIIIGVVVITKPRKDRSKVLFDKDKVRDDIENQYKSSYLGGAATDDSFVSDDAEYIDLNAVFGGVKKIVLSKNFKGGEVNCFMGGAEINLTQCDIKQPVKMEINNVFGGTKVIVPSDWDVKSEATTVFGGVEDKRSIATGVPTPGKTLTIEGNCFFGGIEIKNF